MCGRRVRLAVQLWLMKKGSRPDDEPRLPAARASACGDGIEVALAGGIAATEPSARGAGGGLQVSRLAFGESGLVGIEQRAIIFAAGTNSCRSSTVLSYLHVNVVDAGEVAAWAVEAGDKSERDRVAAL